MRNLPWPLLGLLLALAGYLLFRVEALDARIEEVARAAIPTEAEQEEQQENSREALTDRLRSAEAEVETLRNQLSNLTQRVDPALDDIEGGGNENRILNVVEQENARIRDRQLEFHSARWMERREAALEDFAKRFSLTPWQTQELHRLLQNEIDHMVEILRSKDLLEDPDQAMSDWTAMLEETDREATKVLENEQIDAWNHARAFERAVLMPWLNKP